ncbi:MAG: hypothetical protein K1X67_13175 [Fimbriimonadaceae bacterium]|nr:hypothetical protein [Fimbriimonadaceae bacterium]
MKSIRTFAFLALASVCVAATPQEIKLTRVLKEGTTDVYLVTTKTKQDMDIPQLGAQDMTLDSTMKLSFKYGKVADGKQDIDMIMSDFKMTAGGTLGAMIGDQMAGMLPKELKMTAKMDERGGITDSKTDKMDPMAAMMLNSQQMANSMMMVVFPEKAVKIGDTWTMPIPDNKTAGIKGATMTAKLVGESTVDEVACYEISMDGTIPMKMNMADIAGDTGGAASQIPADMSISGKIMNKATAFVEKGTGRLISFKGVLKSDQNMDMGGQGSAKVTGDTTISLKLQK